uniref:uncharacterized protein n=1 Tax=Pristiophorus japonicus TaxID=55135 RepID=UPI00398EC09A
MPALVDMKLPRYEKWSTLSRAAPWILMTGGQCCVVWRPVSGSKRDDDPHDAISTPVFKGSSKGAICSPNSWSQMDVTNQLSRAVEETEPDLTIVTDEQNEVVEINKDTEDTTNCNNVSTSSMDSCYETNTGPKDMNETCHKSSQQSPTQELDNMQEVRGDENKVSKAHCHHSEADEDTSLDLAEVTEEQNKVIEIIENKDTEDTTNFNDIVTSSTESCSEVNTGSEVMTKSLQEPPERASTLELDDVQRMQGDEDKMLHPQKINKQANKNQSSFDKTTELERNKNNDEKQTLEAELQKCIEDLKKLKIPSTFLKKQRHWQNELLKKYDV